MQLPTGFTAIKDATSVAESVNLIGVLISYDGPKPSRGIDHVLAFTIQDDFTSGSVGGDTSISGRIFKPANKFPKIAGPGDVLIIRKAKLTQWNGRMECISNRGLTSITVFPSNMIPVPDLSHAYQAGSQNLLCDSSSGAPQPTISEQMAVIHLKHASSGSSRQVQQHAATVISKSRTMERDCLIKDLQLATFADVRAQIVNIYRYPMGGQVDLKVTDYTPNESLFYYPDPEKEGGFVADRHWKGPYGCMTLNVTLYEKNANWASVNLSVGDYVFIRNMKVKLSNRNTLEGVVHQDRLNPNKVDIRLLNNPSDIAEIKQRQDEYERKRGGATAFERLQSGPERASVSATRNRKLEKKKRQREEKEAELAEIEKRSREWEVARSGLNANGKLVTASLFVPADPPTVRSAFGDMKLSTISEILHNPHLQVRTLERSTPYTLPFVNCRYRCRVRVVDVFPPKLELFAHATSDPNWNRHAKNPHPQGDVPKERWEWGFVLLLEDAEVPRDTVSEKLRVVVNNSAAQYLLKMNALE